MDIYNDYLSWRFENKDFINKLIDNKSKTIARFNHVIDVVDYLYNKYSKENKLDKDLELIFSTGFEYIYDKFLIIETLYEKNFNSNYAELEKCAKTINLLLYINDFQNEALNYDINISSLNKLEHTITNYIDKKENCPDEYFQVLNDILDDIFEKNNIEITTTEQIFYDIALELNLIEEKANDFNDIIVNKIINEANQ